MTVAMKTKTPTAPKSVIRKVLSSFMAAAIMLTSAIPATAADEIYFFRHKNPVSWTPGSGPVDGEFAKGDDITISFTGVMGTAFSKVIPVKTKDVAVWKLDNGTIQPGLELDATTGIIAGTPSGKTKVFKATILGYSAKGDRIARAQITFVFHNAVGVPQDIVFYGHTNKYLYREIPASVPVATWESLTDLPDNIKPNGRYLEGTPKQEYNTGVAFVGYDFSGKEVAFVSGELIVQDTPMVEFIPDQLRHPTKTFQLSGKVQYKVGELTWRLKPLDGMKANINIGAKNGNIRGTIPTFNTSLRFQAEVVDSDGTIGKSNVFTLTTSSPDTDISKLGDQFGVVNSDFALQITSKDLTGTQSWQVTAGRLPPGLMLDPDTGMISGRPYQEGVYPGIRIAVQTTDGGSSESQPFTFTIVPEAVGVSFTAVDVRTGKSFVSAGPTLEKGIVLPYEFKEATGAVINEELDVDYDTAVVKGQIDVAGSYDVPFSFVNGNGYEQVFTQPITVHEPLQIEYEAELIAYRRAQTSIAPVSLVGLIGSGTFSLASGTLPDGLSIDPTSGSIVGTPIRLGEAVGISVKVTDESGESDVSPLFDIEIKDRPNVQVIASNVDVERIVENNVMAAQAANAFDGVTFLHEDGTLPDGLEIDEFGYITGFTEAPIGAYPNIRVRAIDGEGYKGVSDPFTINVVAPKSLAALDANGTNNVTAQWTAGREFSLQLPRPSNAYGTMTYVLQSLTAGVRVADDKLEGKIDTVGSYVYPISMTDAAGRNLTGTFTLNITPPMTARLDGTGKRIGETVDEVFFDLPRGSDSKINAILVNAVQPVTYSFSGTLPDGIGQSDGVVSGKATTEGQTGAFTLSVTDAAGTTEALLASVSVMPRLPMEVSYTISEPAGIVGKQIGAIMPTVKDGIGTISYKLAGTLPAGLYFDQTTGFIYGTPTKDGFSGDLTVTASDTDEQSPSTDAFGPFKIAIGLEGLPSMATTTNFKVRAGKPFQRSIEVTNVTLPLVFGSVTLEDLPYGLSLGRASGEIAGTLANPGNYPIGTIAVIDAVGRTRQTTVNITAVGPLELTAPTTTTFAQYQPITAATTITNPVGTVVYELVSGSLPAGVTLNPSTGVIGGSSSVKGTFGNLRIKATDSTGDMAYTQTFSITVGDRLPLLMETAESYTVIANKLNSITMPVVNAVGAVTFVQTGTLPEGMEFTDKGVIKGRPTQIGTFPNITVKVTDSVGDSVTKTFSIVSDTNGKPIALSVTDFSTRVGQLITTAQPTWSNHVGEVNFWADDTVAEKGLTIDPATGVITGVSSEIMNFSPNIHITDETDRVTSKTINIKVVGDLGIEAPARLEMSVNKRIYPYVYLDPVNATSSLQWTIEGTLPEGVYFSGSTGRFSGTPTRLGTFPVKVTATEKAGFMAKATANIDLVVTDNGLLPGVAINPSKSGYLVNSTYSITPTYSNWKAGDVLTLAPDSLPLPQGMTFKLNSSGQYILWKDRVAVTETGVYPGIKVRVTDVLGNFSDSEPFAIIYRSYFNYPSQTMNLRSGQEVTVPAPVAENGKPSGTVSFRISGDSTKGSWTVNKDTGELKGYGTSTGYVTMIASDVYEGTTLRNVSFSLYVKINPVVLTAPAELVGISGLPLTSYPVSATNTLPTGVFSTTGNVPTGVSINPNNGAITGTPSAGGTFAFNLVYTDEYGSVSKPITAHITQAVAPGAGYTQFRISMQSGTSAHIWSLAAAGPSGRSLNHISTNGVSSVSGDRLDTMRATSHGNVTSFTTGEYATIVIPTPIANGSVNFLAHAWGGTTVRISASTDGQSWVDIGSRTLTGDTVTYSIPFGFVPPEPTNVDFKLVNSANSQSIVQYSATQANIVITSRKVEDDAPYPVTSWTRTSGSLPPGVTAAPNEDNTAIVYSGHPTATGTWTNTWRATDKHGNSRTSTAVTFTVTSGTSMTLTSSPTSGIQTIQSGRAAATAYVQANNISYGQSGVDWTVNGTLPFGVTWSSTNTRVTFSGTPYKAGNHYLTVVAKDRVKGTTLSKVVELNVTSNIVVYGFQTGTNSANVSCPGGQTGSSCQYYYDRQEILQLGETTPTTGWYIRTSGNEFTTISSAVLAPGYSMPPGLSLVISADKSRVSFEGKPTAAGTFTVALRVTGALSPSHTVEPSKITFVVNP